MKTFLAKPNIDAAGFYTYVCNSCETCRYKTRKRSIRQSWLGRIIVCGESGENKERQIIEDNPLNRILYGEK